MQHMTGTPFRSCSSNGLIINSEALFNFVPAGQTELLGQLAAEYPKARVCRHAHAAATTQLRSAHLCPSFRDFCCERGRTLLYLILGPELHDLTKLEVSLGSKVKSCANLSTALLYRILSNLDARHALMEKLGNTWFRERAADSNDLEGMFSELTRRAGGYMPNFRDAFNALKVAERATRALFAGSWVMYVSKRKRYTVDQSEQTRDPWNSGWRVYNWWPLERFTVGRKPSGLGGTAKMLNRGVKHTEQKQKAVRQQHKYANRA